VNTIDELDDLRTDVRGMHEQILRLQQDSQILHSIRTDMIQMRAVVLDGESEPKMVTSVNKRRHRNA
jgi:hypothetical protein